MRRGFTLIEVLVTVTILGIAAAVVVPQMGSKADLDLSAATRQVLMELDMARSEAITRNTTIYVAFTPATGSTGGSFTVYKTLPSTVLTNPQTMSNWVTTFGGATYSKVKLTAANFDSTTILAFNETGSPYSVNGGTYAATALTSGVVTLTTGTQTSTVKVEALTGSLSVQ